MKTTTVRALAELARASAERPLLEPVLPQLLLLARRVAGEELGIPVAWQRLGVARVCGSAGYCYTIVSGGSSEAWLPLEPLPASYTYPYTPHSVLIQASVSALAGISGATPLIGDYYDIAKAQLCRPKLGCRPVKRGERVEPGSRIAVEALYPVLVAPLLLAAHRWRLRKPRELFVPWAVLCKPSACKQLQCLPPGCRLTVEPRTGSIVVEEGKGIVLDARKPSVTEAFRDTLLTLAYEAKDVETVKPWIWVRGTALVVAAAVESQGREARLQALVWNPSPIPAKNTLQLTGWRIVEATLILGEDTTRLPAMFDRASFVLRGFELGIVDMRIRKTLFGHFKAP